jgi:hypothetical protein
MRIAAAADAAALLRQHRDLLSRLPVTFRAFIGVELEKWPTLFAAEQAYLGALLESIAGWSGPELVDAFAGVTRLETEAGCRGVRENDPRQLQEATQALLRRKGLLPRWRQEVDQVFGRLQPRIDERLHSASTPHRLVVTLYGQGIAIPRDKLWRRLRRIGTRIPLRLEGAQTSESFLRALFGTSAKATLFSALRDSAGHGPHDTWIVEAGEAVHALCEPAAGKGSACATGFSYTRLRAYREMLARSLYKKVVDGVSGPQELAAYARALDLSPPEGALLQSDEVVRAFIRDVFLSGNGTLLLNNTFVEWASVQALKRAEPRMLVARFGVRDKMKPFSSLLLFSSPRATDQVPILEDPLGSFVDVEQLSYYIWLNAEKSAAYRGKTLYLLLAEGVDEMLAIRSDAPRTEAGELPEAALAEVGATMAAWLGVSFGGSPARPLASLAT